MDGLLGTLGAALIAALAAIIAALVAYFTAQRTAQATTALEITRLSVGIQQKTLEQLVTARLVAYPALYRLLSAFRKQTELRPRMIDAPVLSGLLAAVNDWDSEKAILLGPKAANICALFREELGKLAEAVARESRAATDDELGHVEKGLIAHLTRLELALRSDLGVYGVEILERGDVLLELPVDWGSSGTGR